MDDIMQALSQAMSDPATAAQVNGLISALSGSDRQESGSAAAAAPAVQDPDISKLMSVGTAIMQSGQNDPNIALIMALKPLLKEETRYKADRVMKIFRLLSAYPMLKDSGII
jgi:uncharacterized membrane protein